jgi:hypothetical protein
MNSEQTSFAMERAFVERERVCDVACCSGDVRVAVANGTAVACVAHRNISLSCRWSLGPAQRDS